MAHQPIISAFFDEPTNTVSYIVADPGTRKGAVIDPARLRPERQPGRYVPRFKGTGP